MWRKHVRGCDFKAVDINVADLISGAGDRSNCQFRALLCAVIANGELYQGSNSTSASTSYAASSVPGIGLAPILHSATRVTGIFSAHR